MDDALQLADLPLEPTVRPRLATVLGGRPLGPRLKRMTTSRQWNGATFRNGQKTAMMQADQLWTVMSAWWRSRSTQRPPVQLPVEADTAARLRVKPATSLRTSWLGHSSVLIEMDGVTLLTDPVFGPRASPAVFAGPLRFHQVPITLDEMPRLDAVLISHDHYDHLDLPTIRAMVAHPAYAHVLFITALGVGAHLEAWGVPSARIIELDWWEETQLGALKITATPAQHFSGRSPGARDAMLWVGFALHGSSRVFISGDTGMGPHFQDIRNRLGTFDVAMMEIGAFHASWQDLHLGPDNAALAFRALGADRLLPVHWSTFALGPHAWDQPGEQLFQRAQREGLPLLTPRLGQVLEPARETATDPWWRDVKG